MKTLTLSLLVFAALTFPAAAEPLTVKVTNIKKTGVLRIGVYLSKEKWKKFQDKEEWAVFRDIKKPGPVTVKMNLPAGSYVIALYLDLDGDDDLDTNFLGIPVEPLGFSRNPRMLGIPKWKDCVITLPETKAIHIKLNK